MTVERMPSTLLLVETDDRTPGKRIRDRRVALGLSVRELAARSKVSRDAISNAETDDPKVRDTTYARLEAALSEMEHETGMDTPDMVTSTITLADGTTVVFAGTPDAVAATAKQYLADHRQ